MPLSQIVGFTAGILLVLLFLLILNVIDKDPEG